MQALAFDAAVGGEKLSDATLGFVVASPVG